MRPSFEAAPLITPGLPGQPAIAKMDDQTTVTATDGAEACDATPSGERRATATLSSIELFAGCGGLAYGLAEAGFRHALVVEKDSHAAGTLLQNKKRGVRHFKDWNVQSKDVRDVSFDEFPAESIDLVAGGPPCQPFSIGGKHKGPDDERNMWPEAIRVVRVVRPGSFLFENVRGLLRPAFAEYLEYLRLQLAWPEVGGALTWQEALVELRKHAASGAKPSFFVEVRGINAADYGAPQKRHRAMIVGVRADVASVAPFPSVTHSSEALSWVQEIDGTYWERHGLRGRASNLVASGARLRPILIDAGLAPKELPWFTVRDAVGDLPRPGRKRVRIANHVLHPGARLYAKHTGSGWDQPAKALKAGDHGVPGGENILVDAKGAVRYFTLREMARLQGLPDEFEIGGTWKAPIKQLGNAVPVQVGRAFGLALATVISQSRK